MRIKIQIINVLIFLVFAATALTGIPYAATTFNLVETEVIALTFGFVVFFAILTSFAAKFIIGLPFENLTAFLQNILRKRETLNDLPFKAPGEIEETYKIFQGIVNDMKNQAVGLREIGNYREVRQRFVTIASHRLRNPLTGLRWSLDEISRMKRSNDYETELLKGAIQSTGRIAKIIEELLQIISVENEYREDKKESINVVEIIKDIIQETELTAKSRNISMTFNHRPDALPTLSGNKTELRMAIENLIHNAVTYSGSDDEVIIEATRSGNMVEIKIVDHGIGIPEDEQPALFEKFHRGREAFKMDTEGAGLGLYLAKNIIANHGGEILLESKTGVGSTFTVRLPILGPGELETFIGR